MMKISQMGGIILGTLICGVYNKNHICYI